MKLFRHSMLVAAAAMISAAALAASSPRLKTWEDVNDLATPTASFLMGKEKRSLADFKGQVVVLNLWASWCTPCLKELPTLDALEEQYAADGLVVLPLSLDTIPFEQLERFIAKIDLELPHLAQDTSRDVSTNLKSSGVPTTYLIDRQRKIRSRFSGETDWTDEDNTKRIEALLAEGKAR